MPNPNSRKRFEYKHIRDRADGWGMVSHAVNQDNAADGVTFHYYNLKRELI
ncbi:hypothetical protein [Synechococcus sp. RSCCF101]|uniref:hypothetical protein n=1 Tax=Synechococcus sp. RSCCF101 TaxID=2511069 RepID=UPI00177E4D96|nr:hypothetical protein [Synechococcus sp. RSCCF101]